MRNILTLQDLIAHDAKPEIGDERDRYRCPLPACGGKRGRSLSVERENFFWKCHRCGGRGRLGGAVRVGTISAPPKSKEPCLAKLKRVLRESGIVRIENTSGAAYLQKRGIDDSIAAACGVRFARNWYQRSAVLFPIRDGEGKLVATQGRFLQSTGDTKFLTLGSLRQGVFWTPQTHSEPLVIAEAPIDALSLFVMGYSAVATCGTSCPDMLKAAAHGRRVLIATDADYAGDEAAAKWAEKLQSAAVSIERLRPPHCKDWNAELLS